MPHTVQSALDTIRFLTTQADTKTHVQHNPVTLRAES